MRQQDQIIKNYF